MLSAGSIYSNKYFNTFEYDAMGNILTQKRHKQDGTQIEDMSYKYQRDANGFLLSNRLYHVNDAIDSTIDATDIDDQGAGFDPLNININGAYNYVYDEEGRLVKDVAEGIDQIVWRVDGKVKEINRSTSFTMPRLKFDYDAMGRRIAKHVYNNQTGLLEKSTYYLLDAQGNTMATYDYAQVPNQTMSFQLKERHIYGSSRLGMYAESVTLVENPSTENNNTIVNQGFKQYEMTNHLGNVLTVIHDIKIPLNNGSGPAVSSYRVGIRTCSDYSPFGVELDGRTVSGGYRFGYQGSEKDNELKGDGNSYTTEFRQLDPRLGRWLSVDPVFYNFPNFSPFVSMLNNSLIFIDKEGDIVVLYDIQGNKVATISKSEIIVEKGMENSNFIMQYNEAKNYITSYCQNDVFSYLENDERILEIHASDKMDKVGAFRNSGVDIKGEQYVTINNMEILQKFDNVEYKDKKNIGKIFWSPNLGGIDFEDNNHSPAMVLLHEMIHAKHFAENVTQYVKDRNDYNSKKDNQEELKTIKECNDVSKCLPNNDGGNGVDQIRETHQGKGTFVTTSTTSNINPNEWIRN